MTEPSAKVRKAKSLNVSTEAAKPALVAALFADWVTQTIDKKVLIVGGFDRIAYVESNPAKFFIYVRLRSVYSNLAIIVFGPDGNEIGSLEPVFEAQGQSAAINFQQVISPLEISFKQPGIYWFDVQHNGKSLGAVPLPVEPRGGIDGSSSQITSAD